MHSLLSILIDDIDGNIQITTQKVEYPTTEPAFDLLVVKEDSIVKLLEPFLDSIWNPISKLITPKCVVVKLEVDINTICRELYCYFLDRDWPLTQLDISPFGLERVYISETDALRMALSYYKHKDRHTRPLLILPAQTPSPNPAQPLFKIDSGFNENTIELAMCEGDMRVLDCADLAYLLRRSSIKILRLHYCWTTETLIRLLPELRNLPIQLLEMEQEIPAECVPLLIDMVWQNPKLITLEMNRYNIPAFLNSSAQFSPLKLPDCTLQSKNNPLYDDRIEYAMAEMKCRDVVAHQNNGHWNDWITRCPSLIHANHLSCNVSSIANVGHTLTQLETLTLHQLGGSVSPTVLPPHLNALKLHLHAPTEQVWGNQFIFPQYIRRLTLHITACRPIPIDHLQSLADMRYLEALKIDSVSFTPAKSEFPDFKQWPNLTRLSLNLTTVKPAHQILALYPTTQWRSLVLKVEDDDESRLGLFDGLEDADWRSLEYLEMNYLDFMIHANMLKHFSGLIELLVRKVPKDSPLWTRLLEVLRPETHPNLQSLGCYQSGSGWKQIPPFAVKEELLRWPNLISFTDNDTSPQSNRNRVRQAELVNLATHPLWVKTI